jgi:hypothetical protein
LIPCDGELFLQRFDGALADELQLFELTCGTKVGLYYCFNLHVGSKLVYDAVAELMASQNYLGTGDAWLQYQPL